MESLSTVAAVGGLLITAVPLCAVAIGVHRILAFSRKHGHSLARTAAQEAAKPLSNVDAARARAKARYALRQPDAA